MPFSIIRPKPFGVYGKLSPEQGDITTYTVPVEPEDLKLGSVYLFRSKERFTKDKGSLGLYVLSSPDYPKDTKTFALEGYDGEIVQKWMIFIPSSIRDFAFYKQDDAWNRRRHAVAAWSKADEDWKKATSGGGGAASGGYRKTRRRKNKSRRKNMSRYRR